MEDGPPCPARQGLSHYPARDLLCLVWTLDTQGLLIKRERHFLKAAVNLLGAPGGGGEIGVNVSN